MVSDLARHVESEYIQVGKLFFCFVTFHFTDMSGLKNGKPPYAISSDRIRK